MTTLDPADWRLPPDVAVGLASGPPDEHVLSDTERARAAAFGSDERRRLFVLGRTAARTLAARRLGCAPPDAPLVVRENGAPEVEGTFVSIAHAGRGAGAIGAAALAGRPVGLDLETIRRRQPDLWTRILRDDERPVLDALGGPTDEAQTLLWALKESVLKGQQTGLRVGTHSVRLSLNADGAPPDRGAAVAESRQSGNWRLRYGRVGGLWLVVAWAEGEEAVS